MLNFIVKIGIDFKQVRKTHLDTDFVRFHFTSKRKRMSTLTINNGSTEFSYDKRVHMKGAAE
jgi:magnesium-transporting ATPase (P-type)